MRRRIGSWLHKNRPSRRAAGRRKGLAWCLALVIVTLLIFPTPVSLQVTVLEPGDITTPTPTPVVSLQVMLPTPTPTPSPHPARPATQDGTVEQGYTIRSGDTVWRIALEVGVDLDEIPCMVSPQFRPDQPLVVGERLDYLPLGWRCHTFTAGETLASVATQYGVSVQQIVDVPWNQPGIVLSGAAGGEQAGTRDTMEPYAPEPGTNLRIPTQSPLDRQLPSLLIPSGPNAQDSSGADRFLGYMLAQPLSVAPVTAYGVGGPRANVSGPVPKDWPYGSGNFAWPVYGWLSQGYREDHRAIDIAAPVGAFVTAADRGVVIRAGWNDQGYGLFVVIDHNIDYVTLYSHLSEVFVREGEVVGQGQVIGMVGSTGNSTGPHLHFEIRDFGRRTNPLGLLVR